MPNGDRSEKFAWFMTYAAAFAVFAALGLMMLEAPLPEQKERRPVIVQTEETEEWKYVVKSDGSLEASFLDRTNPVIPTSVYEWSGSKMWMTMLTPSGNAAKIKSESFRSGRLKLSGVLPGVDVEYHSIENGVKEDITIINRDAAANGISFYYALKFLGVQPAKEKDGSFKPYVFNSGGKYAFHIAEPVMTDAEGRNSKDITASIRRTRSTDPWFDAKADPYSQWVLIMTPSQKWLLHEYRSYPVVIDPTIIRDESSLGR